MSSWFWPGITTLMKNLVDWVKMTPQEKDEILGSRRIKMCMYCVPTEFELAQFEEWLTLLGEQYGIKFETYVKNNESHLF